MKPDLELAAWREQWQADTEVPADLRRKVERGRATCAFCWRWKC